jgi:nitrite reductase/ring-hydroxylating ferredoxin subunit
LDKIFKKVCLLKDLSPNKGMCFDIDDENEVAVFKIGDKVFAVDNICPHNHVPEIYNGYVEEKNVSCPVHGFTFNLETGLQPTGFGCRLRTYEVKIEGGAVHVAVPEERRFDFGADAYE